jgi:hypothetical protein
MNPSSCNYLHRYVISSELLGILLPPSLSYAFKMSITPIHNDQCPIIVVVYKIMLGFQTG